MNFAKRLRKFMGDESQSDLSWRTRIPQSSISNYLRGVKLPGYHHYRTLCTALPGLFEPVELPKVS